MLGRHSFCISRSRVVAHSRVDNHALLADTVASVQHVGSEFGEVTEDSVMEIINYDPDENIIEILKNYSDSSSDDGDDEPKVLEKVTTARQIAYIYT